MYMCVRARVSVHVCERACECCAEQLVLLVFIRMTPLQELLYETICASKSIRSLIKSEGEVRIATGRLGGRKGGY